MGVVKIGQNFKPYDWILKIREKALAKCTFSNFQNAHDRIL